MNDTARCPPYESVQTIHSHHGQLWAGTPAHFLERLYDDFDYREDDVWLISYPRSGTAWTYTITCAVLYGGDIGALQKAQSENKILKFLPIEVGSATSVTDRINTWKALPSPRVISTHLPFRLFPETAFEHHAKLVYVVRDPKDVAVSFYHFHRSHKLLGFYKGTWDDFFECFISGRVIYGSWFEHTSGWLPRVRQSAGSMLMLQYEDMQQDPATEIRKVSALLDRPLSSEAVEAISARCSFASMNVNPFTNREGDPIMDFSIARFLRKGIAGDWKNYFTQMQEERFQEEWERWISRCPELNTIRQFSH
jgi:hypothetical protein